MDKIAIVYWSGTGNTEAMANAITAGMAETSAPVDLFEVTKTDAAAISAYPKIAFGCPSMGDEVLEEGDFEPFFSAVSASLGGKKIALFGSYGWGDGQWMRDWQTLVENTGANLFEDEGLIAQESPDETICHEFGRRFAAY